MLGALLYAIAMSITHAGDFYTFYHPLKHLQLFPLGAVITSVLASLLVFGTCYIEQYSADSEAWSWIPYISICHSILYLASIFDGVLGTSILRLTGSSEALSVGAWGTLVPLIAPLIYAWHIEREIKKRKKTGKNSVPMQNLSHLGNPGSCRR